LSLVTHAVAIFVVGGVFDRSDMIVILSCWRDYLPSLNLPRDGCSVLSSLTERKFFVQDPISASGSSTVIPTKAVERSTPALINPPAIAPDRFWHKLL
jgi:hypothetical protein